MVGAVSAEAFARVADGVDICYQMFGSPDGDPLLLLMGLGGPMTWWDERLCRRLADEGSFALEGAVWVIDESPTTSGPEAPGGLGG